MKTIIKQSRRKAAFTIIELLTVMSIIVILIGLLVPALNKVKKYATEVKQSAQMHSMDTALELFNNSFEGYPDSGALDSTRPAGLPYCGAMKLCEAMMGQDLLGCHSNSIFKRDGCDATGTINFYPSPALDLSARKGPFLPAENANAFTMSDIYGTTVGSFLPVSRVLCDVFARPLPTGKKAGMPILYYKADTKGTFHEDPLTEDTALTNPPTRTSNNNFIYNYWDNQDLIALGKPGDPIGTEHKLLKPARFYKNITNDKVSTVTNPRPFKSDSYILISAGYDGNYGTADDICNFEWKYRD
jgi:type II secretory pathway pseudopilin PulG